MNVVGKRIGYLVMVAMLLFISVSSAIQPVRVSAEEVVSFQTDFNDEITGDIPKDLDVSENGGTVRLVDLPDISNKSVFLNDTSDTTNVSLSKSFDDLVGIVTVEMSFMQPTYTSSTKVMRIKGDATPVIIETKNGSITYRTGNNYEPLIEVEENQWYRIKVAIDLDTQKADVMINDELLLEAAPLNEVATKIDFIETFTPNSGTDGHYIDDISIQGSSPEEVVEPTDPEPEGDGINGVYEAEYAVLDGAIIDNKHIGFTGTGFVDYNPNAPGGSIEWIVDAPVDGEYNLDFRYAHGGTDLRPAEIMVNGEVVNDGLVFDSTGGFAVWDNTSMKADLKAGENIIIATATGASGGANIDHLKVYMEVDDIYEAEDAALEPDTVIIDNKHIGFTGTGFIDYNPNTPGSWVEWTVDLPIEGDYYLDFRYAHGGTDSRPAEIVVNDEIIEPELTFDPSGGWATWVYTSTQANLKSGENVIRATGVGASGGANIDHLRIHNKDEIDNEGPVDVEDAEIADIISGLELKKLKELGMVVDQKASDDQPITRLAFMSLINEAFGYVEEEKFKNISNDTHVWEISLEEWYSYVLKVAKKEGYMIDLVVDGKINPNEELTKQEAQNIIATIQGESSTSKVEDVLTWGEAKELVAPFRENNSSEQVNIVGVHAVTTNLMVVTLDSYFETFDFSDIDVVIPTNEWEQLSLGFKNLRIDKAAQGINEFGQTVVVLRSLDEWDEYAEYQEQIEEVRFSGDLDKAIQEADNLLTWQMDHGGWTKNWPQIYTRAWDGVESRSEWVEDGNELGTIDNDATIAEMIYLAQIYQETKDAKYQDSLEKALDFLFELQYPTGGFAQVYPARGNYSDYVTFNDEAMVNVLELMDLVSERKYPFDSDLISDEYLVKVTSSIDLAVDYILQAQIEVDGESTAWSAQHDPITYEAKGARAYEHPSISGQESVGIIRYLMSRPQTERINQSVKAALEWLDEVKLEDTRYVSGDPNNEYFVEDTNATAWYRFYEIGTNKPIFSGRDGVIKYDIMEIEEERRNGYSWGGHWGTSLLDIAQQTGNYTNKVFVQVAETKSVDTYGRTLATGDVKELEGQMKRLAEIDNTITVAQDGSGDYDTVQSAIDAVPINNSQTVMIYVKNGTYKEVINIPANKPFITLIGENEKETVITYDNYAGRDNGVGGTLGTSGSASAYLRADDLKVENLTFENSFDETIDTDGRQAVAVYASGDRLYFKNVSFIGNQDTLYVNAGTHYYDHVYVEGDVDFIFGAARVVFANSVIHSFDRGSESTNGYVTAASTLISDEYGMMIMNSKLTSDAAAGTVYLGRPWPSGGNPSAIGSVLIKNSELGEHINPDGWTSMSGLQPEDARLFEYKNTGPGAVVNDSRRQLTDEEEAEWTVENVLKGWNPVPDQEEPEDNPDVEEPEEVPVDEDQQEEGQQDVEDNESSQDEDQENENENENDENEVTDIKAEDTNSGDKNQEKTKSPENLPATATSMFNLLLIGLATLFAGAMLHMLNQNKRNKME
ncbi:pectate lyase [Paraliobacillus sediminis]|uniref:pectate lyase n=1 Tax=Paraliobacillus sediminis TaxID=1885916 RepID=UPI0019682D91|nr:pectate lyase [Paraliobacillus sediminis]